MSRKLGAELRKMEREGLKKLVDGFSQVKKDLLKIYREGAGNIEEVREVFRLHKIDSPAMQAKLLHGVKRGKMDFYCRGLGFGKGGEKHAVDSIKPQKQKREGEKQKPKIEKRRRSEVAKTMKKAKPVVEDTVMTTTEVAGALGVSVPTLHNWIKKGKVTVPPGNENAGRGRGKGIKWTSKHVESIRKSLEK